MTAAGPIPVDAVLYATGRAPIPNTRGLGLEAQGVAMNESGAIAVDTAYRSSVPSIYAVGDCSDHAGCGIDPAQFDLTPVAIAEGRVIAETLFNDNPQRRRLRAGADRGVRHPRGRDGRPERDAGARAGPRGHDLPHQLPAAAAHFDGASRFGP